MTRFECYKKILTQLQAMQITLDTIRDTVKEEIISNSSTGKEAEIK